MTQVQKRNEPKLDKEVEGTFPASDPPSYMGSTAVAGAPKDGVAEGDKPKTAVKQDRIFVDLNQATREELGGLPALGPDHVRAIMTGRPFHSWEDLKGLPEFDGETIAALRKGGAHIGA